MNTKMSKTEMLAAINQQHGTLLELGLDGKDAVISLVKVADITGRSHRHLMERARSFIDGQKLGHQPKNWQIYFSYEPTAYLDGYGREMPTYNLNRAAFFDFVLSMTGKKVDAIRKTYIQAFDAFEQLALHEMHHEVAAVRLKLEHKQHSESIDELVKRLTPVAKMMIMHRQLEPSLSRRATYQYLKKNILDFQSKFPKERDFNIALGKIKWINHDPSSSDNGKAYDRALGRGFVISYNPNKQGVKLEASKITALGILYLQERMEQFYEQSII